MNVCTAVRVAAALAVLVVVVRTASRVAMSTPSNVLLVVIGPVMAPPAKGSLFAASAALLAALVADVAASLALVVAVDALVDAPDALLDDAVAELALAVEELAELVADVLDSLSR